MEKGSIYFNTDLKHDLNTELNNKLGEVSLVMEVN